MTQTLNFPEALSITRRETKTEFQVRVWKDLKESGVADENGLIGVRDYHDIVTRYGSTPRVTQDGVITPGGFSTFTLAVTARRAARNK